MVDQLGHALDHCPRVHMAAHASLGLFCYPKFIFNYLQIRVYASYEVLGFYYFIIPNLFLIRVILFRPLNLIFGFLLIFVNFLSISLR